VTIPRILVIDDQYATRPDMSDDLCWQCGLVEIEPETSDEELKRLKEEKDAIAGVVFSSGQKRRNSTVENSIDEVLRAVQAGWPSKDGWRWALILLDLRFQSAPARGEDESFGFRVLDELVGLYPDPEARSGNSDLPVVMLTTVLRQEGAGKANRTGAMAYVEKEELNRERLEQLLAEHGLIEDPDDLMIGQSLSLLRVLRKARRIARMKSGNALILGPQGAGKTTIARYIHQQSERRGNMVEFYSSPSASELEYQALFGCWQGAHSMAAESLCGKAEAAHQGTLLIDEVHNLKSDTQQELLQFGRPDRSNGRRWLRRLGNFPIARERVNQAIRSVRGELNHDHSLIAVDLLLLSATNEPLNDPDWRASRGFSEPLYTRLAEEYAREPLRLPALAQRPEDIPILFEHFLRQEVNKIGGRTNGTGTKTIDQEVMEALRVYDWPRNLAELSSVALHVAQEAHDYANICIRNLPHLGDATGKTFHPLSHLDLPLLDDTTSRSTQTWATAPDTAPPQHFSLDEAISFLRSVQIPSSSEALRGRLASLRDAYGQLVMELLEMAFRQMQITHGDEFCLPAMKLLLGAEIKKTSDAYTTLLRLKRLFPKDHRLAPDSPLAIALQRAEANRNPKGNSRMDEESDSLFTTRGDISATIDSAP
jgi:DNA-binding NtrC family response regulator